MKRPLQERWVRLMPAECIGLRANATAIEVISLSARCAGGERERRERIAAIQPRRRRRSRLQRARAGTREFVVISPPSTFMEAP
jgi:hypothetical protein